MAVHVPSNSIVSASETKYFEASIIGKVTSEVWQLICKRLPTLDALALSQTCCSLHTHPARTSLNKFNQVVMGVLGAGEAFKDSLRKGMTLKELHLIEKVFQTLLDAPHFLGNNPKFPHTPGDLLKSVSSFRTAAPGVQDISFLTPLQNLTMLDLSFCNQVQDFSFLTPLQNLTTLDLSCCYQIQDFSFLTPLQNLTMLDLSFCSQIQDFSFLTKLQNLTTLDLSCFEQIQNFFFLPQLQNLTTLDLHRCIQIPNNLEKRLSTRQEINRFVLSMAAPTQS